MKNVKTATRTKKNIFYIYGNQYIDGVTRTEP